MPKIYTSWGDRNTFARVIFRCCILHNYFDYRYWPHSSAFINVLSQLSGSMFTVHLFRVTANDHILFPLSLLVY